MTKRTRIYTRTGDAGQTGLVGGGRVAKDSLRIECFGAVDECSCAIGAARDALRSRAQEPGTASKTRAQEPGTALESRERELDAWLAWTQDVLFNLGSDLATPASHRSEKQPRIEQEHVAALERAIDATAAELPALDAFILPGGCTAGAWLHLARAMCRRAERRIVRLSHDESVEPVVLQYVNRLSDALFEWARWINYARGAAESRWNPSSRPPPAAS